MSEILEQLEEVKPRRFQRYPQYKDSGVEWLGETPAHWEVRRLKHAALIIAGQSPPSELVTDGLEGLPFLQGNADFRKLNPSPRQVCDLAPKRASTDDILLSVRAPVGAINIADQPYGIGRGLCAIRPESRLETRFFYYSLHVTRIHLNAIASGSTYDAVSTPQIGDLTTLLPPTSEQTIISTFLDRETAKIDALVAKKERLIELLREKRTALITRAVTKGLDPNVPTKNSGIEWLGRFPRHWMGLPLKRWVNKKITDGPHETPEFQNDGIHFISAEAVSNSKIDFEKRRGFISPELHRYYSQKCRPIRNDILVCKSGATTGKFALVDVDFEFSIWSPLALLRADKSRILPHFLALSLESDYVQNQIKSTWSAGTQPNISMGNLEQLFIVAPPLKEQVKILEYIKGETGTFYQVSLKVRTAIDLLKEYRSALISEAVTGKIDVRGEVQ